MYCNVMALRTAEGSELGRCSARMIVSHYHDCGSDLVNVPHGLHCFDRVLRPRNSQAHFVGNSTSMGGYWRLLFTSFFRRWDTKAGTGRPGDKKNSFVSGQHPIRPRQHCMAWLFLSDTVLAVGLASKSLALGLTRLTQHGL